MARMENCRKLDKIFAELLKQGWRIVKSKHYKCYPPDKQKEMITVSSTSQSFNAIKNIIRDLRNSGALLDKIR